MRQCVEALLKRGSGGAIAVFGQVILAHSHCLKATASKFPLRKNTPRSLRDVRQSLF